MASANGPMTAAAPAARGSRRRSREFALQSLYQWLVTGHDAKDLCQQAAESKEFSRADKAHFEDLVRGVIENASALHAGIQPFLDRPAQSLSPIEHALLLIGAYELMQAKDIPYRVAINEAVELAKVTAARTGTSTSTAYWTNSRRKCGRLDGRAATAV